MATESGKKEITGEQQTSPSNNGIEEHVDLRIRKRDKKRKIVIYVEDESEDNDEAPLTFFTGGVPQIKRYAHEILDHGRSTVEVKPGGAILITPHPRDLPAEIVSMILKHITNQPDLYSLTLVNKHFHSLVNPLLWKDPKILHRKALRLFLSCLADAHHPTPGRLVEHLEIRGDYWTDTKLSLLLPHIRHLKEVLVEPNTRITHTSFNHVPRHCPQLTKIFLGDEKAITDQTIARIPQHCHQLKTLRLVACPRLSDDTFLALGDQCALTSFLFDFSDASFWTEPMIHAVRRWSLVQLVLNTIPAFFAKLLLMPLNNNSQQLPQSTSFAWPKLQRLQLGDCTEIDDTTLVPFLQTHPRLMILDLRGGSLLTDESIDTMAASLRFLTTLLLDHNHFITSAAIRRLVCRCPRLATLSLHECSRIAVGDFPENEIHTETSLIIRAKGLETIRRAARQ
ncbi:hypothetical protein BCR42DRAFT_426512 [Absidia repens]|uniref:F-box domain-containing protein n=1 Tax=Absidia repens TaxID=90262 RepID=A0A1X2I1E0_9FUNG|nr:hypothetical protein BCR42DRAFT_426512 [Absidia repens]